MQPSETFSFQNYRNKKMSQLITEKNYSSQTTIVTSSTDGRIYSKSAISNSNIFSVSNWQRILWLANLLYYQLVAIVTIIIFWTTFENRALNNVMTWHIVLCTAAYLPIMAIAIIAFSTDNLATLYITRKNIYLVHGILLTISCLCVTVGISIEIHSKTQRGRSRHFKSNHAILGLTSWILVLISIFIGRAAAKSQIFSKFVRPIMTKFLHNFLGISAFLLGFSSLMLKYEYFKRNLSAGAYQGLYWVSIYIVVWSLLAALKSLFFQAKGVVS